jgi:hypothetical protein
MVGMTQVMMGMGGPPPALVALGNKSAFASGSTTTTARAGYRLAATGDVQLQEGGAFFNSDTWLLLGAAGDYQVRATLSSGDTPLGTLGTWLALSTDQDWTLSAPLSSDSQCVLTIEIRLASSGEILATASVTLFSSRF